MSAMGISAGADFVLHERRHDFQSFSPCSPLQYGCSALTHCT